MASLYLLYCGVFIYCRLFFFASVALIICLLFSIRILPDIRTQAQACGKTFKILQYNILFENKKIDNLIQFVKKERPDLIVLQEMTPRHGAALQGLHELYPYRYGGQPKVGYPSNQFILSRQPLYGMSVFRTDDDQSLIRGFWQPTPDVDIALFTAHPPSPRGQQLWHRRNLMFQTVTFLTGFVPVENTLVIGDFNLSSDSARYQQLFPGFSSLPVSSWPAISFFPAVGIDHLWIRGSARLCAREAVTQVEGSDHWPVLTHLGI
ncbi:endonuclease/exonuclease/phosphatase family protein [Vibrio aerogenes]|nr:endonuclease/exonuclease/phosphatase family protein [Vibrio aerogenes]